MQNGNVKTMISEKEIEHDIIVATWYIMHKLGDGNIYKGRALLIDSMPTDDEWFDAFEYARGLNPKGWLSSIKQEYVLRIAKNLYQNALVSLCLDTYWYDCGMPTIEVGHKLAASLMLTNSSNEVSESVQLPFPAFKIIVPNNLLTFSDGEVRSIVVGRHIKPEEVPHTVGKQRTPVEGFAMATRAGHGGTFSVASTLPLLFSAKTRLQSPEAIIPVDDADQQKLPFVSQLILGVCLYMTGDSKEFPIKQVGKGHHWEGHARSGPPTIRTYRLTRQVQHDFRTFVSDYCSGKGSKLSVQYMVTGHWRNQPHGPNNTLRKLIFIQPFWKGPADAPIAVRQHKLHELKEE